MKITIPYDVYESEQEIAIILPLGGVKKESVELSIRHEILTITGERTPPQVRKDFSPLQQECFRGPISLTIDLPPNSNYKQIHSTLSPDNILSIIVPKNTIPDSVPVQIEIE